MKFLFDLGGVFFDWNPKYFYKSIFSSVKEMDSFLDTICNKEWNLKQDAGRLIKDGENELINKFPRYTKEIKMYYANHRNMIKRTFQCTIDIFLELKSQGYLCYALSNWSAETYVGMEEDYSFLKKFDGILISGKEKLVKPNKKIYELVISRFFLNPKETIFIDDNLENIDSAKKLNFRTIHLVEPDQIKKEIKKHLKKIRNYK